MSDPKHTPVDQLTLAGLRDEMNLQAARVATWNKRFQHDHERMDPATRAAHADALARYDECALQYRKEQARAWSERQEWINDPDVKVP